MLPFMTRAAYALKTAWNDDLRIVASPWSPPAWLKAKPGEDEDRSMLGSAKECLREGSTSAYAATWALYISKWLAAYAKHSVSIWAVTVQNEPEFAAPWEACSYSKENERDFVAAHLGPVLRRDHPDVKILGFDHNKDHAPAWADALLPSDDIDGIGYHWYVGGGDRLLDGGVGTPNLHRLAKKVKDKGSGLFLQTEGCHCPSSGYTGGALDVNWARAERYGHSVLADLAAGSAGWIEWNLILDKLGGPNHLGNDCDSPLLALSDRADDSAPNGVPDFEPKKDQVAKGDSYSFEELTKFGGQVEHLENGVMTQPMFWVMGHFSRYLRAGSTPVKALIEPRRALGPKTTNNLAREGIEVTSWPCEGGSRQSWVWDTKTKEIKMNVESATSDDDWVCLGKENHVDFGGLTLVKCGDKEKLSGAFEAKGGRIMHKDRCLHINHLENGGGSAGVRGGSQVALGACESSENELFEYSVVSGEIYSKSMDTCFTTGWPFLQGGVFKTHTSKGQGEGMGRGHVKDGVGGGDFVMIVLNESDEDVKVEILGNQMLNVGGHSITTVQFKK
jgi:glucosylceramidase